MNIFRFINEICSLHLDKSRETCGQVIWGSKSLIIWQHKTGQKFSQTPDSFERERKKKGSSTLSVLHTKLVNVKTILLLLYYCVCVLPLVAFSFETHSVTAGRSRRVTRPFCFVFSLHRSKKKKTTDTGYCVCVSFVLDITSLG